MSLAFSLIFAFIKILLLIRYFTRIRCIIFCYRRCGLSVVRALVWNFSLLLPNFRGRERLSLPYILGLGSRQLKFQTMRALVLNAWSKVDTFPIPVLTCGNHLPIPIACMDCFVGSRPQLLTHLWWNCCSNRFAKSHLAIVGLFQAHEALQGLNNCSWLPDIAQVISLCSCVWWRVLLDAATMRVYL